MARIDWFQLQNRNALDKCIGIDPNGRAVLWACNANPDQKWRWGQARSGWRRLVNGDGLCLAVAGASTAPGARILGYRCGSSPDQYWGLYPSEDRYYPYIMNLQSGLIVGVLGGSTANGSPLVQWKREGHLDQYWGLKAVR